MLNEILVFCVKTRKTSLHNNPSNAFVTKIKKIVFIRIQSLLAERVGFEPTEHVLGAHTISSRAR